MPGQTSIARAQRDPSAAGWVGLAAKLWGWPKLESEVTSGAPS